jgi:hypothetical protein
MDANTAVRCMAPFNPAGYGFCVGVGFACLLHCHAIIFQFYQRRREKIPTGIALSGAR